MSASSTRTRAFETRVRCRSAAAERAAARPGRRASDETTAAAPTVNQVCGYNGEAPSGRVGSGCGWWLGESWEAGNLPVRARDKGELAAKQWSCAACAAG